MATGNEASDTIDVTSEQLSGTETQKEEHDQKALLDTLQQDEEAEENVTMSACIHVLP